MQINTRDAAAGVIFIVIAGLFALGTQELTIGTALRMGPGYFPLVLAGVLGLIGFITLFKAVGKAPSPMTGVPWRGLILILGAPVVFGLTLRGLGLGPATALVVAISAFASRRATLVMAASLTVGLTIFCVLVFSFGLGLPVPRIGPWLTF
ncbi:ABC-type antimicrobial peptide transport system permease subunit [Methylopila capsulata]|uniref:ABC-type antimicrobial peptide transport system permease subunit n=1 Tax=Methylopila capsulata TaxID=61654 RepID=A0A9W6IVS6_9HYPH|nr:tripartite tricarboxylate transporter TctB family protein [Methylopila capsulata]MBM7853347.1 ABC-type antimicrobial peptide transport system permease subunit [Methylopila capsulata]GLK57438.1 membrane protein [Methylopila capsulata]